MAKHKKEIIIDNKKECRVCKEWVDISDFPVRNKATGKLCNRCKKCTKEYQKEYRKDNLEELNAKSKASYEANLEDRKAKSRANYEANSEDRKAKNKAYRELHSEEMKAYNKKYREDNLEECRARGRLHYAANPEAYHTQSSKYRADKLSAAPSWRDSKLIKQFRKFARMMTKQTGIKHAVDHIIPLRHGKALEPDKTCNCGCDPKCKCPKSCAFDSQDNLQILTHSQNNKKSNKWQPYVLSEWEPDPRYTGYTFEMFSEHFLKRQN